MTNVESSQRTEREPSPLEEAKRLIKSVDDVHGLLGPAIDQIEAHQKEES